MTSLGQYGPQSERHNLGIESVDHGQRLEVDSLLIVSEESFDRRKPRISDEFTREQTLIDAFNGDAPKSMLLSVDQLQGVLVFFEP